MLLMSYFSNLGVPATGLSPTIDIWEDDGTQVVTAAAMTEIDGGFYKYDFTTYDPDENYSIRADGTATLNDYDRYTTATNENEAAKADVSGVETTLEDVAFDDGVYIDTTYGSAGTAFPIGTAGSPSSNLPDALTIATARGLRKFYLRGAIQLTAAFQGYVIQGTSIPSVVSDVDLNGQLVLGTKFLGVGIIGDYLSFGFFQDCSLIGPIDGLAGTFVNCGFQGTFKVFANTSVFTDRCYSSSSLFLGGKPTVIDLSNDTTGGTYHFLGWSGNLTFKNRTLIGTVVTAEFISGTCIIDSSISATVFYINGVVDLQHTQTGVELVVPNAALSRQSIQNVILSDSTPFPGANVDVAVSTRAPANEYDTELAAIQADLDNPNQYKADVSNLDVAVSTRSSHTAADVWTVATRTLTSFGTLIADMWSYVTRTLTAGTKDTEIDAIKAKTDNLPANPADVSDIPTANDNADQVWDEILSGHLGAGSTGEALDDAASGSGGTTPAAIWAYVTRTLTAGTKDAEIDAIKAKTDNLPADPTSEADATSNKNEIIVEVNANEAKLDIIDSNVDAIKAKTDNLPIDPASEANATANKNSIIVEIDANEAKLDIIDSNVDDIKAKTDNLPVDPTSETNATSNKNEIIVEVNANEAKIDIVDANVDAIKAKTDNLPANPADVSDIPTAAENADQVWDEIAGSHELANSTGEMLRRILYGSR